MSRGNREATTGNIKNSMRDNYSEHGVEEYYKKVGATYRNPHFPGIRHSLFLWFNRWWEEEYSYIGTERFTIFDMAGEATMTFIEWWKLAQSAYSRTESHLTESPRPPHRRANTLPKPTFVNPTLPNPRIIAADPYTAEAYKARTSLTCSSWSFRDIAEGALLSVLKTTNRTVVANDTGTTQDAESTTTVESTEGKEGVHAEDIKVVETTDNSEADHISPIEMTICSFALHLIDSSSELFALLWELSTKSRWLVVLAPHKKPNINLGWGWVKWDANAWSESLMSSASGEYLQDRVHCRIYKSVNV